MSHHGFAESSQLPVAADLLNIVSESIDLNVLKPAVEFLYCIHFGSSRLNPFRHRPGAVKKHAGIRSHACDLTCPKVNLDLDLFCWNQFIRHHALHKKDQDQG